MTNHLNRRAVLAAAPAVIAATTLPASATSEDPILPLYREWLAARHEWLALADLPGNGNWDDPRSVEAEARELNAVEQMLKLTPTSVEGIGALAAVAWYWVMPDAARPDEFAAEAKTYDCRFVMAIWKACTGREGYPTI